jgi:hypothetical protein
MWGMLCSVARAGGGTPHTTCLLPCVNRASVLACTHAPLLQGGAGPASSSGGGVAGAEDLIEREAKRLDVMKRWQERKLAQLVSFEMARKERQDKAEAKVGGAVGWGGAASSGPGCPPGCLAACLATVRCVVGKAATCQ